MVAVNIDTRDPEKPKNFLKEANLTQLGYFTDSKAKVFQDLKSIGKALGMPTSVLVDGKGCEIANLAGPAEWASDDAIKLIKAAMEPAKAGSWLGRLGWTALACLISGGRPHPEEPRSGVSKDEARLPHQPDYMVRDGAFAPPHHEDRGFQGLYLRPQY